jgi:hypothetical protein
MARLASFGPVTAEERRQADLFLAELMGVRPRRRAPVRRAALEGEQQPPALQLGPLSDAEWADIVRMLTVGEVEVGVPLTADADANALRVAARIFCSRNAFALQGGDPLLCVLPDVTASKPEVRALVPHVTARGPIVPWQLVPPDDRIRRVMTLLVGTYRYPVNGAAGLVGNLWAESKLLPSRIEGSAEATPMRARGFSGRTRDFTPDEIIRRSRADRRGPESPGIGLAQWTDAGRRAGLFQHTFRGVVLGPRILFDLDAQVDYLVSELGRPGFAAVERVLRNPSVSVDAASDAVLYDFEIPRRILENGRKLPRTDPRVQAVFGQRRGPAARALRVHTGAATGGRAEHGEAAEPDRHR